MVYIFRVDTGSMLNLDTNLALETVAHLKTSVASYCNIPVDKQVSLLLLSRVRYYSTISESYFLIYSQQQ